MGLDGLLVHCLAHELNAVLENARVHHIAQPRPNDIVITLRQPGANYRLLLSADPSAPRAHLTAIEWPNPLTPPAFCMLLRKHLEPGRLLSVEQAGLDRVLTIRFEVRDELGRRAERLLITEIMGRHSNILLVDPVSGLILDGVRHVSAVQSRHREVMPGRPYIAPPSQNKENSLQVDEDRFLFNLRHIPAPQMLAQAFVERYDGVGPDAAREILHSAGLPHTIKRADLPLDKFAQVWAAYNDITNAITSQRIKPWGASDSKGKPAFYWVMPLSHLSVVAERLFENTSAVLDWFYGERQTAIVLENMRQSLARPVRTAWEKVTKRIGLQEAALQDAANADDLRLNGELLQAQQHAVPAKASNVALPNYYEPGSSLEIMLNPSLSASDNAQNYFRRYQKAKKTQKQAQLQLDAALEEKAYLESVQEVVERAETIADLHEVQEELHAQGLLTVKLPRQKSTAAPSGYLSVLSQDGIEILVGKNNRQNDAITMGIAKPDDLWLHVKDIPGAHVVVRADGKPISDETMSLALHLAAFYSRARQSSKAPVDYCQRRYVRKPRGAKPGFVIYDHQKTAYITPDVEEIKRLQD